MNHLEKGSTKEKTKSKINWTAIGTIIALVGLAWSFWVFKTEIDSQKATELEGHISNIRSLELELEADITAMNSLVEENLTKKTFHEQYILESLERSVSDGNIMNETVKDFIIKAYRDGVGLNNRLLYLNSPEFISLKFSNKTFEKELEHFMKQTQDKTQEKYIPSFETILKIVSNYRLCLETEQNIINC